MPMSRSAAGAFISLLLSQPSSLVAERSIAGDVVEIHHAHTHKVKKLQVAQSSAACNTDRINELISQNKPGNLPWNEIMPYADDFIKAQTKDIAQLEEEESRLTKLIAEQQAEADQGELSTEDSTFLINQALQPFEEDGVALKNFGSASIAVRTKCGGDMFSEDAEAAMTDAGLELEDLLTFYDDDSVLEKAFAAAFAEKTAGSGIAVNPKVVTAACETVLGVTEESSDDPDNFCPRLCTKLVEKANSLSSGYKTRNDILESRSNGLAQVQNALNLARSSKAACEKKKQDLEAMKVQLQALSSEQKDCDKDRIKARIQVKGAMKALQKYKALVRQQEIKMEALYLLLEKIGLEVVEMRNVLNLATEKRNHLDQETKKGEKRLAKIESNLEKMLNAIEAASDLRGRVIGILLRMVIFYEEMVRDPIRALGITRESRIRETFAEKQTETLGADLSAELQGVAKYCGEADTVSSLKGMGGKNDASALCAVGDPTAIDQEIKETVDRRQHVAIHRFLQLQDELDIYKGSNRTVDRVRADEADGGLVSLSEVFATYADTNFYRDYLQKWELSGPFKQITTAMEATLLELEEAKQKESELLASLRQQLSEAEAERQRAEVELKAVEEKLAETKALTEQEEKTFAELKKIKALKEEALRNFMALSKASDANMKAVTDRLKAAHSKHAEMQSFFQALESGRKHRSAHRHAW